MTQFLIMIFAPRGRLDFVVKMVLLNAACCLLYAGIELALDGYPPEGFADDLKTVLLTAAPFFALSLWLFGYMYVLQGELADLASRDMLTGLPNRRFFMQNAAHACRTPGGVLMMVDVDHFKRINDTYGHATGDAVLETLGRHMQAVIRTGDLVARIGGEEFAIFLNNAPGEVVQDIGNRLSEGIILPTHHGKERITVSIGAAMSDGIRALDRLLREADDALYRAKAEGRARLVVAAA